MSFVAVRNRIDSAIRTSAKETAMSIFTHELMTNHHAHEGVFGRISDTLHVWHERQVARRELAKFSERDLHDVGLSSTDAHYEASKHFWQS